MWLYTDHILHTWSAPSQMYVSPIPIPLQFIKFWVKKITAAGGWSLIQSFVNIILSIDWWNSMFVQSPWEGVEACCPLRLTPENCVSALMVNPSGRSRMVFTVMISINKIQIRVYICFELIKKTCLLRMELIVTSLFV